MAALGEQLEHAARDAIALLDRLVGIGVGAERDRLADVARLREFGAQQLDRVGLREQPGLEVEARGEFEVAVRRPREAVRAAVLAAAIGIERLGEGDVGGVVAAQD
jgi:hypothetical protein